MRNKLTNIGIKRATGKLFDGAGLHLIRSGDGGKWIFRYSHLKRRREMGLGSWPTIGLAAARASRDRWALVLASGRDPIAVRQAERDAEMQERDRRDPTLAELTAETFEARQATLRGGGKRGRWLSPLEGHVLPKIGGRRVSTLLPADVRDVLKPIWREKHPTAIKAIQRLRLVFQHGQLVGHKCDPLTVDSAQRMLGQVEHVAKPIKSTPWQDMPALYAKLDDGASTSMCLRWAMLTAVRLDGCRGARAVEIDGDVWTVPADRVKGRQGKVTDFRVPLAPLAVDLAHEALTRSASLLFPGQTGRGPITDRALELCLDRHNEPGRPHGFRSSIRSWIQDTQACSFDVAETILGHTVGAKIERTYARSDLLDLRRPVMARWAEFLAGN